MVMLAMYLVYKALLSGEKQHAYNRTLLLAMYVLSPVIVVLAAAVSLPSVDIPAQEGLTGQEMLELMMANADLTPSGTSSSPLWARIMLGIWIAGMVAVAASTAYSWIKVRRILKGCSGVLRIFFGEANQSAFDFKGTHFRQSPFKVAVFRIGGNLVHFGYMC